MKAAPDRPKPQANRRKALQWMTAAACGSTFAPHATSAGSASADAMLSAADAIRNPSQPFRVTVTLTEFERGVQVGTTTLATYARMLEVGGQFASIVKFMQPVRDAGKLMLKSGSDLWFYDPTTKAAVRISPQQRLIGQASNGDVVTVNFARDYQASVAAEEALVDGERKQRNAVKLALKASTADATYGSAELWLDAGSHAPIKAKFFADTGRLLKTAYYRRYQPQLGTDRPMETVIIDGLEPQSVTLVRLSDYTLRNLPTTLFQRDQLAKFNLD